MIVTRTPFRVSFVGGGSDLPAFYSRNGYGSVISAAIKKYMYITIHPYFQDKIRIKYSVTEDVETIDEIKHPIVRECLKKVNIDKGIEIASFADVPSGTGLGSSSAFTVGLLHALYAYKGEVVSKAQLAKEACDIEMNILKEPIGKQDQYAAAFGNINCFRFNSDESVEVNPILLEEETKKELESFLCLYYTGNVRDARDILLAQKNNMTQDDKFNFLKKMLPFVDKFKDRLEAKDMLGVGAILDKSWMLKKELAAGISNSFIDNIYEKALANDMLGGKLLGAGGGGFMLFASNNHDKLKKHLNCRTLPFEIDREGTKILFYEG